MKSSIVVPAAVAPCKSPASERICDMKAEHLKARGNEELKRKNYGEAISR